MIRFLGLGMQIPSITALPGIPALSGEADASSVTAAPGKPPSSSHQRTRSLLGQLSTSSPSHILEWELVETGRGSGSPEQPPRDLTQGHGGGGPQEGTNDSWHSRSTCYVIVCAVFHMTLTANAVGSLINPPETGEDTEAWRSEVASPTVPHAVSKERGGARRLCSEPRALLSE